jgi:hypothetical protein
VAKRKRNACQKWREGLRSSFTWRWACQIVEPKSASELCQYHCEICLGDYAGDNAGDEGSGDVGDNEEGEGWVGGLFGGLGGSGWGGGCQIE